jgi:hypothetical protein
MWDLWWTKWHWDKFFSEYFGFSLSVSFHWCSIKCKAGKTLIVFITVLHSKILDCDPFVASATGPFAKKKSHLTD